MARTHLRSVPSYADYNLEDRSEGRRTRYPNQPFAGLHGLPDAPIRVDAVRASITSGWSRNARRPMFLNDLLTLRLNGSRPAAPCLRRIPAGAAARFSAKP